MKIAVSLVAFLFPALAFANPSEVFQCTTPGDALDSVSVGVNSIPENTDTVYLTVTYMSEKSKTYRADVEKGTLSEQLNDGRVQLVLMTPDSNEFGGAVSDSALFVLNKAANGEFGGYLAIDGIVNTLICQ